MRIIRLLPVVLAGALVCSGPLDAVEHHRSKRKRAVAIAGTAAGGALVGGLAGGKRGAAAGAVGGGSAAALYTGARHRGRRVHRTGKERARLIGLSAGAGAATGALAGGGKGAAIGAGVGAAAGYVLDHKTRTHRHRRRRQ